MTTENGMFELHDVTSGITYQLRVSAKEFAGLTSNPITLNPDQFKIVSGFQLRIATESTTVDVGYDPVEVAAEQFRAEEKQRIFGVIPKVYVSYENDFAPFTAKMKFKLALKVSTDSVTATGVIVASCSPVRANLTLWHLPDDLPQFSHVDDVRSPVYTSLPCGLP